MPSPGAADANASVRPQGVDRPPTEPNDAHEPPVLYEIDDGIATITFNRPHRYNAMSDELMFDMVDVVRNAATDPEVRVIVLTGSGRAFCAGGDLAERVAKNQGATVAFKREVDDLKAKVSGVSLLRGCGKPAIAAINGPCAGAGIGWATACTIRVAAERATFRAGFVAAGMSGDFGLTWSLPRLVGEGRAADLLLTNERIDAREAKAIGLVTRVVPDAELADVVHQLAVQLRDSAPIAMDMVLANLRESPFIGFDEALAMEASRQVVCARTDDASEAAMAFLDKRRPRFQGR